MMPLITFSSVPNQQRTKEPRRLSQRVGRWIDSVASDLAPSWGAKRVAARHRQRMSEKQVELWDRLGYSWPGAAHSDSRSGRYLGTRMHPDEAIEHDLPNLRANCVELYRGNTVAHAAVEGRVSHEVGTGITRQPRVRRDTGDNPKIDKELAEAINDSLKEVCDRWSDHGVDKKRRLSLPALQRLVCRTYATYGECFIQVGEAAYRGSIGMTLDVISPERVETPPGYRMDPQVRMGIRYSKRNGQILGYYVRHSHPDQRVGYRYGWKFVPRFDRNGQCRMLHIFDPVFPEQSRGIPWLATAMNRAKDTDDFFEAELIAKQIEAAFGLIFTGGKNAPSPQDVAEGAATATNAAGNRMEDIEPGFIHYASEGEEVKTVDPSRPGASFAPFIEASLRSVSAALNFPYEILAKNFFRTTFSSGRLAMLDGWVAFAMRQQVLIDQFLKPVWRRLVHDAVFAGEMEGLIDIVDYLERPHVYERHRWLGQGKGFIDPDKEVRAHIRANEGGIETKAEIVGEKGGDWEDTEEQLDVEERKKIELRTDREKWENELREQAGLPPLARTYTENIGGATKVTDDDPTDDTSIDDESQEQQDRELEGAEA